jgi:hypothetical protein
LIDLLLQGLRAFRWRLSQRRCRQHGHDKNKETGMKKLHTLSPTQIGF